LALGLAGRLGDARIYAEAALEIFQAFGNGATTQVQNAESLIANIDKAANMDSEG